MTLMSIVTRVDSGGIVQLVNINIAVVACLSIVIMTQAHLVGGVLCVCGYTLRRTSARLLLINTIDRNIHILLIDQYLVIESSNMSSSDSADVNGIDVGNIVLKTQKKLLSTFANRKTLGPVLDEDGKKLLNSVYRLFKEAMGKKDAQKITSRWIKILVKITFLIKNDQFDPDELKRLDQVQSLFVTIVKVILSFWRIEYSFECSHLQEKLQLLQTCLSSIVARHMTDKNKNKLRDILAVVSSDKFLTNIFTCDKSSRMATLMQEFVDNLESLAINNKL